MKLDRKIRLLEKHYSADLFSQTTKISLEGLALRTGLPLETVKQFHEKYQRLKIEFLKNFKKIDIKQLSYPIRRLIGPENETSNLMVTLYSERECDKEGIVQDFRSNLDHYSYNEEVTAEKLNPFFWDTTLMIHSQNLESFVFLRTYKDLILRTNFS
jgi:hypothetical protein